MDYKSIYERLHQTEHYGKTAEHGYGGEALIPEKVSIIDLGAGLTAYTKRLGEMKQLTRIVAVDISPLAVQHQISMGVEAVCACATKLPFVNNEFDIGLSFGMFEHLTLEDLDIAIIEFARVCKTKLITHNGTGSSVWLNTELHLIQEEPEWWVEKFNAVGASHISGKFIITILDKS